MRQELHRRRKATPSLFRWIVGLLLLSGILCGSLGVYGYRFGKTVAFKSYLWSLVAALNRQSDSEKASYFIEEAVAWIELSSDQIYEFVQRNKYYLDSDRYVQIAPKAGVVDIWGTPLRVVLHKTEDELRFVGWSGGPDRRAGTKDDYVYLPNHRAWFFSEVLKMTLRGEPDENEW